jgi:hypothetical protein
MSELRRSLACDVRDTTPGRRAGSGKTSILSLSDNSDLNTKLRRRAVTHTLASRRLGWATLMRRADVSATKSSGAP